MSADLKNQSLAPIAADRTVFVAAVDPIENAITLWAEASTRTETRDREERLRDKQQIIRSFLQFVGKHPGEVEPMDVRAWRKHLESKKSENTVYSYLSRVSSFYEWLRKHPEIKDHIRSNPVSMTRPTAPLPYQTEKTKAWTDDEMNAILDAIAVEAEKGSIHALRDYAVTLFYLFSGLRRNELFGLRGSDIERGFPRTEIDQHFLTLQKWAAAISPMDGWPQSTSHLRSQQNVDRFSPKLTVHGNSKFSDIKESTAPRRTERPYLQARNASLY